MLVTKTIYQCIFFTELSYKSIIQVPFSNHTGSRDKKFPYDNIGLQDHDAGTLIVIGLLLPRPYHVTMESMPAVYSIG